MIESIWKYTLGKLAQMQIIWLLLLWSKFCEETFENTQCLILYLKTCVVLKADPVVTWTNINLLCKSDADEWSNQQICCTNIHHSLSHRVLIDSVDCHSPWKAPWFYGITHVNAYVDFVAWFPPNKNLPSVVDTGWVFCWMIHSWTAGHLDVWMWAPSSSLVFLVQMFWSWDMHTIYLFWLYINWYL